MSGQEVIISPTQVIHTEQHKQDVESKRRSVEEAQLEMKRRKEELKVLHERDQQLREEETLKRKEAMELQIKNKILASNRYLYSIISFKYY